MLDAKTIEKAIIDESEKLIERFNSYHNALHIQWMRQRKLAPGKSAKFVKRPDYWELDKKFEPFYCKRRAKAIARSVAIKIRNGDYEPRSPHEKLIPKKSGGDRKLTIYQIPDAAVSKILYQRLLLKNKHRFSAFAYAYRDDRNVHFAIQDMYIELAKSNRAFIAEYDFSDFFGNIDHTFLLGELEKYGLLVSETDLRIIKTFIGTGKGIPQGTSISLFLANVACLSLDNELERLGVKFARYADDTVIVSDSYEAICDAVAALARFSTRSGVPINNTKSDGIHLITSDIRKAEFRAKPAFEFLGYEVGTDRLSIKQSSLSKIKKEISYILYAHLIKPLKSKTLAGVAIPTHSKDPALLSAIMQIRRYVCGGITKSQFDKYSRGEVGQLKFKGVMSFYPLIDDVDQLKNLDGWLVSTIHRALKLRAKLLAGHGFTRAASFPFSVARNKLVHAFSTQNVMGHNLLEIPSFVSMQRSMSKGLREYGIQYVMNSRSNIYSYDDQFF